MKTGERNQIILVRGGESFDTKERFYEYLRNRPREEVGQRKSWRDWVGWALSETYDYYEPRMPNKQWADYEAWKIWFEKYFEVLTNQKLILMGNSLGSLFLAKYLCEEGFPRTINQLHLVCPIVNNEGLVGETVGNFTLDPEKLPRLADLAETVYLYHSQDDPLVPFSHGEEYARRIPSATFEVFTDRGHFFQPAFMELLINIKKLDT